MKLTARDVKLVRDIALSHVLSRDQIVGLGYFGSVTRANTRLRLLRELGVVKVIDTPFFSQHLHSVGPWADSILTDQIRAVVSGRSPSPRFLQHALAVTNVRIHLQQKGADRWLFEPQARTSFNWSGRTWEVRPDGLAKTSSGLLVVEVDLGHVNPAKFKEKLAGFDAFLRSGQCKAYWSSSSFRVFTVTTGKLRARRLTSQLPKQCMFDFLAVPHDQLGIAFTGSWS